MAVLTISKAPYAYAPHDVLTEAQAAQYLQVTPKKLRRLGYEGRGPRFRKLGREHLFRFSDLTAWLGQDA